MTASNRFSKTNTKSKKGENGERSCVVCRTTQNCDEMIRFVLGPDNQVAVDLNRKLPGRGVWVCAKRGNIEKAIEQKAFARGFKAAVNVDKELPQLIGNMLHNAALKNLSLAKKSGGAISGFTKVTSALKSGKAYALLHSLDASSDGIRKINQIVKQSGFNLLPIGKSESGSIKDELDDEKTDKTGKILQVFSLFQSHDLSSALGADNTKHVVVMNSGAGLAFIKRINLLINYQSDL